MVLPPIHRKSSSSPGLNAIVSLDGAREPSPRYVICFAERLFRKSSFSFALSTILRSPLGNAVYGKGLFAMPKKPVFYP